MLRQTKRGFTIIELLAVIAIISVLMAITFPVIGSIKRKNAETQCMTNMSQLFTAMKAFQQDQHCYPEFIAGPVQWQTYVDGTGNLQISIGSDGRPLVRPINKCTGTLDNIATFDASNNPVILYPNPERTPVGQVVSLYPEYIKSLNGLNCPFGSTSTTRDQRVSSSTGDDNENGSYSLIAEDPMYPVLNNLQSVLSDPSKFKPLRLGTDPDDVTKSYPFYLYAYSSYDFQVTSPTAVSGEVHYSTLWTVNEGDQSNENDYAAQQYLRQLHWKNPPEDAIVTWCSSHIYGDGGNCIVLFLDGRAQKFPAGTVGAIAEHSASDYADEPSWMAMWHIAPKQ